MAFKVSILITAIAIVVVVVVVVVINNNTWQLFHIHYLNLKFDI